MFWEAASDVEACTITIRHGELGTSPSPTVERFSNAGESARAFDQRTRAAREEGFLHLRGRALEEFLSTTPRVINEALIQRIEETFANTPRGRIGIHEAAAIDMRMNPGEVEADPVGYAAAIAEDALVHDWRDLSDELLANDPNVFSYLDPAGFEFVLPAVMRWSLAIAFEHTLDPWGVASALRWKLGREPDRRTIVGDWLEEFARVNPVT